ILVEQLAQKGLLKVICGTDTLGVGINVPIRTVLFTRLCKFDGQKTAILAARDFHQIAGRAGRKGFDSVGWVVAQAPEHVVENLKLEEKARRDGRKVVKRQPPEKNFVNWDRQTFERLIQAPPERLTSRFQVSHGLLLNVLARPGDGCQAMRQILRSCHDSPTQKQAHGRRAWQLFRALVDRGIVEIPGRAPAPPSPPGPTPKLRLNVALQDDFSMDQALSLYLLDTLPRLDPAAPDYPLDVITLVESILEDPDIVLRRQLDRLKGQRIAELKAEGMDYHDRLEELEKLEHPKPRREFIYDTFNAFAAQHPWVGQENIRPKSIVREMFEEFRSFSDYVKRYELPRAEGVLLRHVTSVYKVLRQTVPGTAKTEPVRELEEYLRVMIRQVDSSLLDEWERLRHPEAAPRPEAPEVRPPGAEEAARDLTRDLPAFTASIRTRVFALLRALANGEAAAALDALAVDDTSSPAGEASPAGEWNPARLEAALREYHAEHERICLDPEARNLRHTHVKVAEDRQSWTVEQVLVDPDGFNDWSCVFHIDLPRSRAAGEPVVSLARFGPVGR
ncbi:MAG: DUF3516 domain-containing protein, partial [Verrucomicrobiota bacterium]